MEYNSESEEVNGVDGNNEECTDDKNDDRGTEEQRKIFVGGVNFKTNEKDFQAYFEKFGAIEKAVLKTHPSGDNRGYGFVHFEHKDSVDAVMAEENHMLDDKKLGPRRGKKDRPKAEPILKVYIGGKETPLDESVTEEVLTKYFENFGKVREIILPVDKNTDKRRNFGFIRFEEDQFVLAAVASNNKNGQQQINGTYYDIKKSEPREMLNDQWGDRGGYGPPPRRYDDYYDRGYGRYDDYRPRYEPRGYDRGYGRPAYGDPYGPRDDYRRAPRSPPRYGRSRMTPY